jgi:hypothetical protein
MKFLKKAKHTTFVLSALLLSTLSASTMARELVTEINIHERLFPDAETIYSKNIELDSPQLISEIGLLTDWWMKRPTEVRVYKNNNGEKGAIIGYKQFLNYNANVCGADFESVCKYPENGVARLMVTINEQPFVSDSVIVEVDGLLDVNNGYAIIKSFQVFTQPQ